MVNIEEKSCTWVGIGGWGFRLRVCSTKSIRKKQTVDTLQSTGIVLFLLQHCVSADGRRGWKGQGGYKCFSICLLQCAILYIALQLHGWVLTHSESTHHQQVCDVESYSPQHMQMCLSENPRRLLAELEPHIHRTIHENNKLSYIILYYKLWWIHTEKLYQMNCCVREHLQWGVWMRVFLQLVI